MWDPTQKSNIRIIGVDEGEEQQVNGIDQIFNKIMKKTFPKKTHTHKDIRSTQNKNRQDQKRKSQENIIALSIHKNKLF